MAQEPQYRQGMSSTKRQALYEDLIQRYDAAVLDGLGNEWLELSMRNRNPVKRGEFEYKNGYVYWNTLNVELMDGAMVETIPEEGRRYNFGDRGYERLAKFETNVLTMEADMAEAKYTAKLYGEILPVDTPIVQIGDTFMCGALVAIADALGAERVADAGSSKAIPIPPNYDGRPQWKGEWLYVRFIDFESLNRFNTVRDLLESALQNEYRRGTDDGGNLLMALHKGTMTIENFNRSLEDRQRASSMHRLA